MSMLMRNIGLWFSFLVHLRLVSVSGSRRPHRMTWEVLAPLLFSGSDRLLFKGSVEFLGDPVWAGSFVGWFPATNPVPSVGVERVRGRTSA